MSNRILSILIVEDDMVLSMVESQMVEKLGYQVAGVASTGEEAIEQVQKNKPDAVLMDIKLDGELDGFETMQRIRQIEQIPVIYVSGHSTKESHETARQMGCSEYLVKPIRKNDLEEALTRLFSSSTCIPSA